MILFLHSEETNNGRFILTSPVTEEELTLTVKWAGKEYTVRVCANDFVAELKRRIF
ncbi:putative protein-serine/threonine phosphatase [Helianthus anomalus]